MSRKSKLPLQPGKCKSPLQSVTSVLPVLEPAEYNACDGAVWIAPNECAYVRVLKRSQLNKRSKDFDKAIRSALRPEEWNFLTGITTLKIAREKRDTLAARKAYDLLEGYFRQEAPRYRGIEQNEQWIEQELMRDLSWLASKALEGARMVFWIKGQPIESGAVIRGEFMPGIYCPTRKTAIAMKMILSNSVRICPHCDSLFSVKLPKQQCCSISCREAHRVARWRDRKKGRA
jgi:hypothetical protein